MLHPYSFITVQSFEGGETCHVLADEKVAKNLYLSLQSQHVPIGALLKNHQPDTTGAVEIFEADRDNNFTAYYRIQKLRLCLRAWAGEWRRHNDLPAIDTIHVRGMEKADLSDVLGKPVRLHLKDKSKRLVQILEPANDFTDRITGIRVSNVDGSRDEFIYFQQIEEFEFLP